jgi:hypothetical protein
MRVIENELSVFCDVDDTILKWIEPTVPGIGKLEVEFAGKKVYLTPHQYHVDLLRMYKTRGYHITVWSANGPQHAAQAVRVLGLENIIDDARGKPSKYMDDSSDAAAILGPRVFCEDLTKPVYTFVENPSNREPIIAYDFWASLK